MLKFPVVKDFAGVQGKVLYVKQDLPASMPLRLGTDRVEVAGGFFPVGGYVTALCSGSKLGSAVAGDTAFSVPISSPPPGAAVAVVESERELPSVAWVFRGVPQWSPGKNAVLLSPSAMVGDRLGVIVKDPYQYSTWYSLAVFDGTKWTVAAPFNLGNWGPCDAVAVNGEFWFVAAYSGWWSIVRCTRDLGMSWYDRPPSMYGRFLRRSGDDVLFHDVGGSYSTCALYRWDQGQAKWIRVAGGWDVSSIAPGTYAQQEGRLYATWNGMVKELVSGTWVDVAELPAGISRAAFAVCPDGSLWVIDGTGCTWRRGPGDAEWVNCGKPLGFTPSVLAAMPDNSVWAAVNTGNNTWAIARWNGSVWVDMGHPVQAPGSSVKLFPGPGGSLYVLGIGSWYYGYAGQGLYELPCALAP